MTVSPTTESSRQSRPLLVFACHEAWVHQLRWLQRPLDIVVGLRGRPQGWDERMRPVPPQARLIRLEDALRSATPYHCIVAHNLSDLLDAKSLPGPRLLMLHETLDGAAREQQLAIPVSRLRETIATFLRLTNTHTVAVSPLKGRSWGLDGDVVSAAADPADYGPWRGEFARGLRVANHVERRPHTLLWEFHRHAFEALPVTLVGHNPGLPGAAGPAQNWADLKEIFRQHRFYIHTADPQFEDGYNMATLEAMAAGLPVLGNRHPTSPVEHGVSGFLSDDPVELRGYALRLLEDRALAARMGAAARASAGKRFPPERFRNGFRQSVETARRRWSLGPCSWASAPSALAEAGR